MRRYLMLAFALLSLALGGAWGDTPAPLAAAVRVKDITQVAGARDNQLFGYGLVVGLNGTGDSNQTQFTAQALAGMLQQLGVNVPTARMRVKNVAAVMVTADIGPFRASGDRIDVQVSSLGDASSLQGGLLLQTPLMGADRKVYAVAQGAVSLGGYAAGAAGSAKISGHPTVGRIPGGALVEAEIPFTLGRNDTVTLALNAPDFTTAARLAGAINTRFDGAASARNAVSVDVRIPAAYQGRVVELVAHLGELTLVPDAPARVVINERTGTVVVGNTVTITPVAVAQGNLTVSISAGLLVSQPPPFSEDGKTVARDVALIEVEEPRVSLTALHGGTVDELVRTLNAMKVSPRDIIAILQALKQAGALQAELIIM